jgi:DNA-binding transcriptional LysR family regulator
MDRIGDLNLFLRVLDLGSISAAARSLDVSVAVASQRLKRPEQSLGVRLFHRTTRRLRLTSLPESGIYAVMPQRRLVPARARAFADFLALHFGRTPPWDRHLK